MHRRKAIGIDISLMHRNIGMAVLLRAVLPEILNCTDYSFVLFSTHKKSLNLVMDKEHITKVYVPFDVLPFQKQNPLYEQLILPFLIARYHLDLMFFPYNTMPLIRFSKYKAIVAIHDLIYFKSAHEVEPPTNFFQKIGWHYRRLIVARIASKADGIITDSNYSKQDLVMHFSAIPENYIHVLYAAIDPLYFTKEANEVVLHRYH